MSSRRPRSRRSLPSALAVALLAAVTLLGLVPTGGQAQDQVELRIWDQFTGANTDAVGALYQAYMDANPNVTITREVVDSDTMRDTINTAMGSGTGPDIINYDAGPAYAGVLAEAGVLAPLTDYAAQYGWADRISAPALEGTTIDGTLYGLPLTTDVIGVYANTTLIAEQGLTVPETFEQLVTFCTDAAAKGFIPMALSANPGWENFHQFSMVANAMLGPDAVRALLLENQGSWDSPQVVAAIDAYFVQLRDAGCFSDDVVALTYDDAAALFYTGESLLMPTGSWMISNIEENMPDAEVGFAPFPQLPDATGRYWVSGVGSAYYISAQSPQQAEAAELLEFLFSPEVGTRWVQEAQLFVPLQIDDTALTLSPLSALVVDTQQAALAGEQQLGYNIDVLAPEAFNAVMQNGFQATLNGDKTAQEMATELQTAWLGTQQATPTP